MICKYCGTQMDDNCKFCVSCGRSVEPEAEITQSPGAPEASTASPAPQANVTTSVRFDPETGEKIITTTPDSTVPKESILTKHPASPVIIPVTVYEAPPEAVRYDPITGERVILGTDGSYIPVPERAAPVQPQSTISHTVPTGMTMNNPNYCTGSTVPHDGISYGTPIDPSKGGSNEPNLHVGQINPSEFINADKPINPTEGIDLTGYVPPKPPEKEFKVYSTGHMVFCVIIITILAIACGIFASLFFTTYGKYGKLTEQYNNTVQQYERIIENMQDK